MSSKNRRAKIVCTIGPASSKPEMVDRLVRAGMDVARLNFSHGAPAEHAQRVAAIRRAAGIHEKPIAILGDLQGPKIRTGKLAGGGKINLSVGQKFVITTENTLGNCDGVSTTFQELPHAVHKGDRILLSDGEIALRVESTQGRRVITRVEDGGELGEHQGINLPGVKLQIPSLTPKDRKDLVFALSLGVNYLALSFVRSARDVKAAKAAVARAGKTTPVIAKLEKPEAIENLDEILSVADGVMVARGDLGVEMNPEQVPVVQKQIISRARNTLVPVITATQMLDSMTQNPRPTRAEASDVANALLDGSDALMLSAETGAGLYPVKSVQMMDRIIREAESSIGTFLHPHSERAWDVAETTAELICHGAEEVPMRAIAVFTETGSTARLISKHRPRPPIIAFTPLAETRRRLALLWGVVPRSIARVRNIDDLASLAEKRLLEEGLVRRGEVVGIVAGKPLGNRGQTHIT